MTIKDQTIVTLNKVSPCMCLAKWTSVTLHLESGTTHSCHHPQAHKIPLDELKENVAALHNTQFKIEQRKKMIDGIRPVECEYCWNIEDLATSEVSDRFIKSSEEYSLNELDLILQSPLSNKIKPKYLEVSFSNKCNFKCSYCSADYSSAWSDEINKFGRYATDTGNKYQETFEEEVNPYIKAFWQWWPEIKNNLHTFRITGGEPLLSVSTFKILENLLKNPEPNLSLIINSNLGVPNILMNKFIDLAKQLISQKCVAKLEVYTSADTIGQQAEYIRFGFKNEVFWQNIEKILNIDEKINILIMCTFNALSVDSYIPFLEKITEFNKKFRTGQRVQPIVLDISYLRYPDYQTVRILPDSYVNKMLEILTYLEKNQWFLTQDKAGFSDYQIMKFKRIVEWMRVPITVDQKNELKRRFYLFFYEHDKRRNLNFVEAFPDLKMLWLECQILATNSIGHRS